MSNTTKKPGSAAARLRELLAADGMIHVPGVHDPFSARVAQDLGFSAVTIGGGVTVSVAYHAIPDMTMLSTRDIIDVARGITRVIDIPLIVDFDDGGGNPLQVRQAVQLAEAAGIAGMMIEDTNFAYPKHTPPKQLGKLMKFSDNHHLTRDAAVQRVRAAVEARRDPDTVIVARTDSALISKDEAMIRMRLFAEVGADVIKPTHIDWEDIGEAIEASSGVPLMMVPVRFGSTSPEERELALKYGVKILLDPVPVSYSMYEAAIKTLTELKETGGVRADYSGTAKTVQETIRYREWGELADRYQALGTPQ